MNKFELGTRVKLKHYSEFSHQSKGHSGTVATKPYTGESKWCGVKWDHGYENSYPKKDLIIIDNDWDE